MLYFLAWQMTSSTDPSVSPLVIITVLFWQTTHPPPAPFSPLTPPRLLFSRLEEHCSIQCVRDSSDPPHGARIRGAFNPSQAVVPLKKAGSEWRGTALLVWLWIRSLGSPHPRDRIGIRIRMARLNWCFAAILNWGKFLFFCLFPLRLSRNEKVSPHHPQHPGVYLKIILLEAPTNHWFYSFGISRVLHSPYSLVWMKYITAVPRNVNQTEDAFVFTAATLCLSGCPFISWGCGAYEILQVVKFGLEPTVCFYWHSIHYHNNEVLQCIKRLFLFFCVWHLGRELRKVIFWSYLWRLGMRARHVLWIAVWRIS